MELLRKTFNPVTYLTTNGIGRRLVRYAAKQSLFVQGGAADSVFYIHHGRAKLTVVSKSGKEATVTLLGAGDFIGEESVSNSGERRKATASAITACAALKIDRIEMVRILHEEHSFSDYFLKYLVARNIRTQADLVDQLFNSSERRLARLLLLMADYGRLSEPQALIPKISQQALSEMVGTTRSRVSFFMNRFRQLGYIDYGYIDYKSRIQVHKSLLSVVLRDEMPNDNSSRSKLFDSSPSPAKNAKSTKVA